MKKRSRAKRRNSKNRNSLLMLYTSLFSIALSMVCLAGASWAWFTSNQIIGVGEIKASSGWTVQTAAVSMIPSANDLVMQIASDSNSTPVQPEVSVEMQDGEISFEAHANTIYVADVKVGGDASKGFLMVSTCDGDFYTTDRSSVFSLLLSQSGTVTVRASWGFAPEDAVYFSDGDKLGDGKLPVCICEYLCSEDEMNADCVICGENHEFCEGKACSECTCTMKCTEDGNPDCDVCQSDVEGCMGVAEDTKVTVTQTTAPTQSEAGTTGAAEETEAAETETAEHETAETEISETNTTAPESTESKTEEESTSAPGESQTEADPTAAPSEFQEKSETMTPVEPETTSAPNDPTESTEDIIARESEETTL